jgi:hypothetical protein
MHQVNSTLQAIPAERGAIAVEKSRIFDKDAAWIFENNRYPITCHIGRNPLFTQAVSMLDKRGDGADDQEHRQRLSVKKAGH